MQDNHEIAKEELARLTVFDPETINEIASFWHIPRKLARLYWQQLHQTTQNDKKVLTPASN